MDLKEYFQITIRQCFQDIGYFSTSQNKKILFDILILETFSDIAELRSFSGFAELRIFFYIYIAGHEISLDLLGLEIFLTSQNLEYF